MIEGHVYDHRVAGTVNVITQRSLGVNMIGSEGVFNSRRWSERLGAGNLNLKLYAIAVS